MVLVNVLAEVLENEVGRYAVSIWVMGVNDPVVQHANSRADVARIILWAKGDPSIVRIVTVDTATGRRLGVWTR